MMCDRRFIDGMPLIVVAGLRAGKVQAQAEGRPTATIDETLDRELTADS